jgi:short-subunit dehydrogenase
MSTPKFKAKPIEEQTIVITGATNGIGLATAKMAAEKGANVILVGRNGDELDRVTDEIVKAGGHAIAVTANVSQLEDLKRLQRIAIETFGQIDTWINHAAMSIYGYMMDSDISEERKLFETNFWGTRFGSQVAVEMMQEKGGVLINLGSEVSVAAQPLLGIYSASKCALKAFTEALRLELRDKNIPIEVCLVRPTNIESSFPEHEALAILKCAEHPQRDVYVGGPARLSAILDTFFPTVKDMMTESKLKELKTLKDH